MSQTAFVWLSAYTASAFMAFVNPAYGLFGYFLDYYAHPPLRWWGDDLPGLRWSLIISLVTLVGMLIHQTKLSEVKTRIPSSSEMAHYVCCHEHPGDTHDGHHKGLKAGIKQ